MLYYPNVPSKTNQFCAATAQAIRRYLQARNDPRGAFSAPDLAQAGIPVPKGGFRQLRSRGWIRLTEIAPNHRRFWQLTESALAWLNQQQGAQIHV